MSANCTDCGFDVYETDTGWECPMCGLEKLKQQLDRKDERIKELEEELKERLGNSLELCKIKDNQIRVLRRKEQQLKDYQEFIQDCSVSHHETRYKYRAQVLIGNIQRNRR